MNRGERFDLLTQTGAHTEMGRLLRRFWHPVALSRHVAPGSAIPLRVLGEELTLYRGASAKAYLVGGRCAHRRTELHTGWVEGERIRCIYHGWQYDGSGQCTHRPAENDPGLPRCRIPAYPVHEYCGLVFAWLGEAPAPEFDLPRKAAFERSGGCIAVGHERWDTNWFQQVENSLDATHVSFVHQALRVGVFGQAVTTAVPQSLEYEETEAGLRQVARRSENNVRESDWTFPNNNHIVIPGLHADDPWIDVGVWMVPSDDLHTTRYLIYALPPASEAARERFEGYFARYADYHPAERYDELFHLKRYPPPEDALVGLTAAQDYLAIRGQGRVAQREKEMLGRSDLGIVTLRRLFWRELDALRAGTPAKHWRRRHKAAELPKQPGAAHA